MTMQTDVLSGHLHHSGFIVTQQRSRVKAISIRGTSNAGQFDLFSTLTAPVQATYGQANNTITITSNSHGLSNGAQIGISFSDGTGGAGFPGNYNITYGNVNSFSITSPNNTNVSTGTSCIYVNNGAWLVTFETVANDTFQNYFLLPGEGILAKQTVYAYLSNISVATVFYG